MEGDFDEIAVAGEMFVDGIIENFEYAVVEPSFIGIADVHAWAFANGLQALEFIDLRSTVFLAIGHGGVPDFFGIFGVLIHFLHNW